jgi:hypothetical protein
MRECFSFARHERLVPSSTVRRESADGVLQAANIRGKEEEEGEENSTDEYFFSDSATCAICDFLLFLFPPLYIQ